mmetsp:Transcript_470/g.733  ORF Transcript_470/g.733 Transcript_470/m.733 type:complete len:134 (+) Transcript_470:262-663(+)
MVPGIKSPMSVYTQVPQLTEEENHQQKEQNDQSSSKQALSTESSPFLPQHKQQQLSDTNSSIHSVPIALAPTILPLTYDPNKKHAKRRHLFCHCRGIFTLILAFLVLTILIHYIVWICLNKDKDVSWADFILH